MHKNASIYIVMHTYNSLFPVGLAHGSHWWEWIRHASWGGKGGTWDSSRGHSVSRPAQEWTEHMRMQLHARTLKSPESIASCFLFKLFPSFIFLFQIDACHINELSLCWLKATQIGSDPDSRPYGLCTSEYDKFHREKLSPSQHFSFKVSIDTHQTDAGRGKCLRKQRQKRTKKDG